MISSVIVFERQKMQTALLRITAKTIKVIACARYRGPVRRIEERSLMNIS
jgi:hypothetical protein